MTALATAIDGLGRHEAAQSRQRRILPRLLAKNARRVSLPLTIRSHPALAGSSGLMLSLLRLSPGSRYTSWLAQREPP
jgi:hypothetical protein